MNSSYHNSFLAVIQTGSNCGGIDVLRMTQTQMLTKCGYDDGMEYLVHQFHYQGVC